MMLAVSAGAATSESFYAELRPFERFADVLDPSVFSRVPSDWLLVLTDVRGSTRAIEAGRYKDVNALGVASIVAVNNALPGLRVPFVFGGDGATLLVPGSRRAAVEVALRGLRDVSREAFELELRTAMVPIAELERAAHSIAVARFRASPSVSFAMFAGDGLTVAEAWIKDATVGRRFAVEPEGDRHADLTGFECRWQPIPAAEGQVVSLLVGALDRDPDAARRTYRNVIERIDHLLESHSARPPLGEERLRLSPVTSSFAQEARLRSGAAEGAAYRARVRQTQLATAIGKLALGLGFAVGGFDGRRYRREALANSDFRKFDEMLRMVLDMNDGACAALTEYLDAEHAAGKLAYGLHRSAAALMTCFVTSYAGDHVHFIDGADGGYAMAAKQLKRQLARRSPS